MLLPYNLNIRGTGLECEFLKQFVSTKYVNFCRSQGLGSIRVVMNAGFKIRYLESNAIWLLISSVFVAVLQAPDQEWRQLTKFRL